MPLYLNFENSGWDKSYISNGRYKNLNQSFKDTINNLSITNKIILIYPVHETGVNVHRNY